MLSAGILGFIRFESPAYLALFAVVPLLVALSFRSLSGLGPVRRWLAILIRCAVVALMVMALAGARTVKTSEELTTLFVVDRSSSIPRELQDKMLGYLRSVGESAGPRDRMGIVAFDGKSAVELLPTGRFNFDKISEPVDPDHTDLAGAMRMAMALFPPDTARRIVVVSDGNENIGEALNEADQLKATGVPIDVLPLQYDHAEEVVFERLSAPSTAALEETVNLQMVVRSTKRVRGRIVLKHNDEIVPIGPNGTTSPIVEFGPGPERFEFPVQLRDEGAHRFEATFEPDSAAGDTVTGNNRGRAFTVVGGQGRILILTTQEDRESAQLMADAMRREQLLVDVEIAGERPLDQLRLLQYSLIVLSNIPANYISEQEQLGLSVYVRELGGGLVMVGGDESFGAGGWMGSPVEDIMPVSFDVKSKRQIPKGALVLTMHACEIPQGNYWGERIAVASVKTLSSRDYVGVLSYQWISAKQKFWVVPLQTVGDKTKVIQQVLKMQMGDMPSLEEVMTDGIDELARRTDAQARHMIVISDFDPQGPTPALIGKAKRNGITISTVAIGYGAHMIDETKAKWIADETKGKFYSTQNYSELPQIFIKESRVVQRALINETPFRPRISNSLSPTIAGLAGDGVPDLGGYVVTTKRPTADVALIRKTEESDDPVLAQWQVGLGKTVAFTSGMWHRWGADWAQWQKFSKLWAQIARWASRQADAGAFDVATSVQGGRGKIRIDARDKSAVAVNFMTVEGSLIVPGFDSKKIRLTQTGPGRYEGEFDARDPGSYIVNLSYRSGSEGSAAAGTLQTGFSIAYSPEFRDLRTNLALLQNLSERTGGRMLTATDARAPFDRTALPKAEARPPIWEDLIRWMLLLFLLDVAVRRIAINPMDMARRVRKYIGEIAGPRKPSETAEAVLSTLKGARDQLREASGATAPPSETGVAPNRSAKYEAPTTAAKVSEQLSKALGGASAEDQPVVARPTKKPTATNEADYTSRLLKAKKRARDDLSKPEE